MNSIRQFLAPPVFPDDEDKTRAAHVLNTLALNIVGVLVLFSIAAPLIVVKILANLIFMLVALVILTAVHWIMRRGHVRLASAMFVSGLWIIVTVFLPLAGGITSVVAALYIAGTIIAGLLLGERAALLYAAACSLAGLAMVIAEAGGHLSYPVFPMPARVGWLDVTLTLLMTLTALNLTLRSLQGALVRARHNERALAESNRNLETEIAERMHAEEALRESEEMLRFIFENASDGISVYEEFPESETRSLVDCNSRYAEIAGRSKQELLELKNTLPIQRTVGAEVNREEFVKALQEEGTYKGLFSWVRPDGKENIIDYAAVPVMKSGRILIVGIDRDITEQKRGEETLKRRNRELTTLYEAATAISSDLSLDTVLQTVAQQMVRALDSSGCALSLWNREENLLEALVDYSAVSPDATDAKGTIYDLTDYPATQLVLETGHPMVIRHDDPTADKAELALMEKQKVLALLMLPLIAREQVVGLAELTDEVEARDFTPEEIRLAQSLAAQAAVAIENARLYETAQRELTERKRAEEALRQYATELETSNEELDAFAHTVAHDLKSPLGLIVGFSEVLEEDYDQELSTDARRTLHAIAWHGRKMGNIISELLLLASVRKMDQVLLEPLDMASIVAEAQGRLSHMIEEYQAEIILPDAWTTVLGYGPWVEEVWVNYLSNALKYGGQPPRVELGFEMVNGGHGSARFWVRDNGPGLTPEEQERLFRSFERLYQVRVKGHGLGLSIVRRIVEKLGGEVGVESALGRGSVFSFTLDLAPLTPEIQEN